MKENQKSSVSKTTAQEISDEDIETAFRALATFKCSVCNHPLKDDDTKQSPWYQKRDKHVCCNTAHCPYCGKPASEKCRHLVSYKSDGKWRASQLFKRGKNAIRSTAPAHRISDDQLIDWEDEQKKKAFASAYPYLTSVYGEGFIYSSTCDIPMTSIIATKVLRAEHSLQAHVGGRYNSYNFTADGDAERIKAKHVMNDLASGIEKMKKQVPSAKRFLIREITPYLPQNVIDSSESSNSSSHETSKITALLFSPDGRFLLVGIPGEGQLWDVTTGELRQRFLLPLEKTSNCDDLVAAFSPEGNRLSLSSSQSGFYHYYTKATKRVARTNIFDVASGEMVGELDHIDLPTQYTGEITDALLAGGSIVARARGRFLNLTPVDEEGIRSLGCNKMLRLPHRTVIRRCAFSPDGRTFASVQSISPYGLIFESRVLLWRLPDERQ
jgi:WD40 repeat protein